MPEDTDLENLAGGETPDAGGETQDDGPAPEVLSRAKEMGWVPKDQWRGDPEKWTDAEEFVSRGEEVLPIIRANNRRLQQELSSRDNELKETQRKLKEMQDSIAALTEIQNREAVGRIDRQINVARRNIEEARAERDTDKVLEEQAKLDALLEEKTKLKTPQQAQDDDDDDDDVPAISPRVKQEINDWREENDWYGTDKLRTRVMNAISFELRNDPAWKKVFGKDFLDEAVRRTDEELGESGRSRSNPNKTSGGSTNGARTGGSAAGRRGKSYADLPADAKAACDADAQRVVGADKVFKKVEDYRAYYVKEYFGESA